MNSDVTIEVPTKAITIPVGAAVRVSAVVSRGGQPDLAGAALRDVKAPTLLIVGEYNEPVITMNQTAYEQFRCTKALEVVPRATHLFTVPRKAGSSA
jgi:putative phosphoribosyl transferase